MTDKEGRSDAGDSIAKGAAWMVLFKLIDRSVGIVSTLVLARLLTPADFGLVAMATAVVALVELMSAFGFDVAIIQRRNATREHFDTAWTFAVMLGVGIAVVLALLAWPVAQFYREPRLLEILLVLAAASLLQGIENVGTIMFRKEMNFKREFAFFAMKRLVTFVITMTLAFTLRSYWALVGGVVAGKLVAVVLSYVVHPFRPRLSLAASKDLFDFSKWLFANNLVNFVQTRSSDFVIGRTLGASTLGIFNVAIEIATLPSSELVAPLNRAALPGYAKVAHDLPAMRATFLSLVGVVCLLVFPVGAGLASVAAPAVRLLLGEQWLNAIPLIQVLAVCGAITALQSNLAQVLLALGLARVITLMSVGVVIVQVPAVYFASVHVGLAGVAWVYLACSIATVPVVHAVFFRVSRLSLGTYVANIWRPIASALAMAAAVVESRAWLTARDPTLSPALELVFGITVGVIVYTALLGLLWLACGRPVGAEASAIRTARARLSRPVP